jgi:hypothetical protein
LYDGIAQQPLANRVHAGVIQFAIEEIQVGHIHSYIGMDAKRANVVVDAGAPRIVEMGFGANFNSIHGFSAADQRG